MELRVTRKCTWYVFFQWTLLLGLAFPCQAQKHDTTRVLQYVLNSVVLESNDKQTTITLDSIADFNNFTLRSCIDQLKISAHLGEASKKELSNTFKNIPAINLKSILSEDERIKFQSATNRVTSKPQLYSAKISSPIFFEDGSVCFVMYHLKDTGGRCLLLKWENNKWKVLDVLSQWYD